MGRRQVSPLRIRQASLRVQVRLPPETRRLLAAVQASLDRVVDSQHPLIKAASETIP